MPAWGGGLLLRVYDALARNDPPQPADLIFVLAGGAERKQYGIELYRDGYAPRLLLSVGRFEVSRMESLGLGDCAELVRLRDRTPPHERHFFLQTDPTGTHVRVVKLRRWNTYGEALALKRFLEERDFRQILVISSAFHLQRVALIFRNVFEGSPLRFLYCPVPVRLDPLPRETWWVRRPHRTPVLREAIKLLGYRVAFRLPPRVVSALLRLKPEPQGGRGA